MGNWLKKLTKTQSPIPSNSQQSNTANNSPSSISQPYSKQNHTQCHAYHSHNIKTRQYGLLVYKGDQNNLKECHVGLLGCEKKQGYNFNGNWRNLGMIWLINEIVCWDVKTSLNLSNNYEPRILKQIEQICFPNLMTLNIGGNRIISLQGISRIYMPKIKIINLGDNQIRCLRDLRRVYCPQLEQIQISTDTIEGFSPLSQLICTKNCNFKQYKKHTHRTIQLSIFRFYGESAKFQGSPHANAETVKSFKFSFNGKH